jgi:hypothetical protein
MGRKKKWNDYYSDEAFDYVVALVKNGLQTTTAVQLMCKQLGLNQNSTVERVYRKKINKLGLSTIATGMENADEFKKAKEKVFNSKKKRFIISWCQSDTDIHEDFFTNIEAYAEFIDADIHIIAGRYKNPNSLEASKQQESKEKNKNYWHKRVIPYLDANRQNLHELLCVLSDVKIQPTASSPLSGLNSITALESCIIGHPRVHLKSLAVLDGYPNKLLLTTGALSVPNYTDTKTGVKSAFHHTFGFVIVELDGDIFHVRQIQCSDDGSFYDLNTFVSDGECTNQIKEKYPAIIFGDLHYGNHSEVALKTSLNMAYNFDVDKIIIHDILDGKSISHHELNNPFIQMENELTGKGDLEAELNSVVDFINENNDFNFIVVSANHNDFVDRWLNNTDWRKVPNRRAYLKYANIVADGLAPKGIVAYVLENQTSNCKCLGINDSCRLLDWELAMHGHIGQNGSRGSVTQFKNLNTKTITGHSHTPAREDGSVVVGTLTNLRLGYNNGASSWMHSNAIMYPNGKVSQLNIIKGRYTTLI